MLQKTRKFYTTPWCKELLHNADLFCFNGIRDLTDIVVSYCDIEVPTINTPLEWVLTNVLRRVRYSGNPINNEYDEIKDIVRELYLINTNTLLIRNFNNEIELIILLPHRSNEAVLRYRKISYGYYLSEITDKITEDSIFAKHPVFHFRLLELLLTNNEYAIFHKPVILSKRKYMTHVKSLSDIAVSKISYGSSIITSYPDDKRHIRHLVMRKNKVYLPRHLIQAKEAWF